MTYKELERSTVTVTSQTESYPYENPEVQPRTVYKKHSIKCFNLPCLLSEFFFLPHIDVKDVLFLPMFVSLLPAILELSPTKVSIFSPVFP